MDLTTTRNSPKPFTWSYSRLKNYESCPKRHYEIDITKNVKEDESEALLWGNRVHAGFAARLSKNVPLPDGMAEWEPWCERILSTPGQILVEQKLAITKDFGPTGFFERNVWFRGVADLLKINGPVALAIDWKTGKIVEDSQQLALMAACIFAHHSEVQVIRTEFAWLKDDASSRVDFKRSEMARMWANLWPRIEALERAHNTTTYPAKPGALCRRWCPVKSCPHHGT